MSDVAAELSCKEAARLMSKRQDAALSLDEQEDLKNHLYECLELPAIRAATGFSAAACAALRQGRCGRR